MSGSYYEDSSNRGNVNELLDQAELYRDQSLEYANNAANSAANSNNSAISAADSAAQANAVLSTSLLKANNLNDLQNLSDARINLGVGNVDNTSDRDKPISIAQENGLVSKDSSTGSAKIPSGTTSERPASPQAGMFRHNTTTNRFEGYNNGSWTKIGSDVDSVNGKIGVVVLNSSDVGADPSGTASSYMNSHLSTPDPHPQYITPTEGGSLYSPLSHVGSGGTSHANVVASGASGFMTGPDKAKLDGIQTSATANPNTDSLTEGLTNKYFTEARVRATVLTGLSTVNNSAVVATDTVLVGFGKLQAQIGAVASALDTINGVII